MAQSITMKAINPMPETEFTHREIDEAWLPGTWGRDCNGLSVILICPGCKVPGVLDHEVDAEGNVTPSVDCPECEYHETGVKLIGWEAADA